MKRINKYTIPIILLAVISSGCKKYLTTGEFSKDEIIFSTIIASDNLTKAAGQYTANNLNTLGAFAVAGYDNSVKTIDRDSVKYKSGSWRFVTPRYWQEGHTMTFWADANVPSWASTSVVSESSMSLSITEMPASASSHWDPMIGYYHGPGDKGHAVIQFYHPMTAVEFRTGSLGDAKYNVTGISSVTLKDVYKSGTATFTGGTPVGLSWAPGSVKTDVVGAFSGTGTSGKSASPFIIIPQTLTTANASIEVTVTRSSGGPKTMYALFNTGSWEAGKKYIYTLDYVCNEMNEDLVVTLSDWTNLAPTDSSKDYFEAQYD